MRRDVQEIFKMTPHEKQVMMFSATLNKEIRPVCKKFMQDVIITAVSYVYLAFYFLITLAELLRIKMAVNKIPVKETNQQALRSYPCFHAILVD